VIPGADLRPLHAQSIVWRSPGTYHFWVSIARAGGGIVPRRAYDPTLMRIFTDASAKTGTDAATSLALKGRKVAIVDGDLNAPSITAMLGMKPPRHLPLTEGIQPIAGPHGLRVVSSEMLPGGEPAPISFLELDAAESAKPADDGRCAEIGYSDALVRMLSQARFGALDLMLIDLAPGLDRLHDLARIVALSGVVLVSHPSDLAVRHARRALKIAADSKAAILGVVENMTGFNCDSCRSVRPLMPEGRMSALTSEFGIPLLGHLPFDPRVAEGSDRGMVTVHELAESPIAKLLAEVAHQIQQAIAVRAPVESAQV
jgi:ATP-binding protein involved in chromosome partitioning